jgi:hypothetical protein
VWQTGDHVVVMLRTDSGDEPIRGRLLSDYIAGQTAVEIRPDNGTRIHVIVPARVAAVYPATEEIGAF